MEIQMLKTVSEVKPQSRLLTIPVVAERLGISTRKTWQLISQGQLSAVHIGLRSTRIAEADLEAFIEKLRELAIHQN